MDENFQQKICLKLFLIAQDSLKFMKSHKINQKLFSWKHFRKKKKLILNLKPNPKLSAVKHNFWFQFSFKRKTIFKRRERKQSQF